MNNLSQVRVDVSKRSGFDKSFKNILTSKVGTITPLAYKLLIPNSDFNLSLAVSAALPPLASDTFMRCSLKVEAFAVPMRLLYGGFVSWLTGEDIYKFDSSSIDPARARLPRYLLTTEYATNPAYSGPGTLLDYLGFVNYPIQNPSSGALPADYYLNVFPILCYHRIYDDWYRNRRVQKPLFGRPSLSNSGGLGFGGLSALPYYASDGFIDISPVSGFLDGSSAYELHQRNYGSDYFTEASPTAQMGDAQKVTINTADNTFTISALRAANAMQQFEEKNNLASPALQDYCLINYGAHLSSGIAQRAIYLGSASYDVYSKGIEANAASTPTNNPFGSVGARYGNAFASGSDFIVKGHVDEPCYLMVLATLVPEANYASGIKRDLMIFTEDGSLMDMPNPAFELIGNEPIYSSELGTIESGQDIYGNVFGWHPRYMWHKAAHNEVHGLLLDGQSLASFVAQRSVDSAVLGSDFLQIGTDDLDNVTAVTGDLSRYGVWIDSYVRLRVVEPLGESQLPSLVDPAMEHGDSIYVRRNGSRIA